MQMADVHFLDLVELVADVEVAAEAERHDEKHEGAAPDEDALWPPSPFGPASSAAAPVGCSSLAAGGRIGHGTAGYILCVRIFTHHPLWRAGCCHQVPEGRLASQYKGYGAPRPSPEVRQRSAGDTRAVHDARRLVGGGRTTMKELVGSRLLLPSFERCADTVGFHDGDYHATFAQHAGRVLRLTDALRRELNLERGSRFSIMAANSHEFLELYHAAFLGGGIINPLNLRLAPREIQMILADSATEVVFVDSLFASHLLRSIAPVRSELPLRAVVLIGTGDHAHEIGYEELLEPGHPTAPPEPEEGEPVVLMYTGGTTGL